jgi:hypothetical protein
MTRLVFALWAAGAVALFVVEDYRLAGAVWLTLKLAGIALLFLPPPRWGRRGDQAV